MPLLPFFLVVGLALYGAITAEIGWGEAAAYVLGCLAVLAGAMAGWYPGHLVIVANVVCAIILLFRCGIANAPARS